MNFRRPFIILLGLSLWVFSWTALPSPAASLTEAPVRMHWLGLNQIGTATNSAQFLKVWRLPQTGALVAQTLDKISRLPCRGATNTASALLRPLLDDLVSSEFYLEVDALPKSQLPELESQIFLAIHLPTERARLWQTNLAAALVAWTGIQPVTKDNGWLFPRQLAPVEFARVGEWTLVGLGNNPSISESAFAARIAHRPTASVNGLWLESDLNFETSSNWLAPSLSAVSSELSILNSIHIELSGTPDGVLTRATVNLARPLEEPLPSWDIPTNLIHPPLTSFTAVRGISSWLAASPVWQKTRLDLPPDQAFFWAQEGVPFLTCLAAPLPGASNQLAQLSVRLIKEANPWLATNGEGHFEWRTNPPAIVWNGAFLLSPYLEPVSINQRDYLFGGLTPPAPDESNPAPAEILRPLLDSSNLVYYQSEQTGQRVEDGQFINQLIRVVFHKPQIPGESAAGLWLKAIEPLLGDSTTILSRTGPKQLVFTRQSTTGLTALELHLLAEWLESPQFPHGLHSTSQ